ncbi:MAG TPA: beta-galactosidase [Chitinophaga sp.]|uniref:beta-galactosidase n=1 Tax=Chitinophaga sp. TaxID=1869181 RepID=UPI002C8A5276|nr:beta-galactosidase [Chitinophaga sp.]HVI48232.1 beta-galactosidase [Chitinophaga sp.]
MSVKKILHHILLSSLLAISFIGSSTATGIIRRFPHPGKIRYDGDCMIIDNKPTFILSAAFHYFRCPEELWRDRFRKIKAAGFNTVETYIPWNWHERKAPASVTDQSGLDFSELKAWLKMAQEEFGLYTIVRPGPFICAEWSGGGYPRWLAAYSPGKEGFWLRSADPEHIKWCVHWFDAACKAVAGEQITRKKKGEKGIIMLQLENEYDSHETGNKAAFLKALYRSAVRNRIEVPLFTCLTSECRGSKDTELSDVFDCDNYYTDDNGAAGCAFRMADLKARQPNAPGFVTELQGGWFSLVTHKLSEENYSDATHLQAISLMTLLGGGTGMNYYMFVGGTHFGGWGARGMTTTYDYNAAIGEDGSCGPKYYVAKAMADFIKRYEQQLLRAKGGPCQLTGVPKSISGGVRMAPDGTWFVFLYNSDRTATLKGNVNVIPGKVARPTDAVYNIDQNGQHVSIKSQAAASAKDSLSIPTVALDYELAPLTAKVLVIPPGATAAEGTWYPHQHTRVTRYADSSSVVRIGQAFTTTDPVNTAQWKPLMPGLSLTQLGINDFRYSLYRTTCLLNDKQAQSEKYLLFNMFTRDIVTVTVNGTPARRIFPEKADAQSWTTRGCFDRIRPEEFDNRFDVSGLLHQGNNEINVLYEDLGHAHGYVPMEELAGIRKAGLSVTDTALTHPLQWQYAADVAGITQGYHLPGYKATGWKITKLDASMPIPRKGNNIQPKDTMQQLMTWYRVEFTLPEGMTNAAWQARISASGNGFMWLNGHDIGRHWEAGPQREFYLPECWLKFGKPGKNVLVMALRETKNGALLKALEIVPYITRAT